jgi:hypothetical protein
MGGIFDISEEEKQRRKDAGPKSLTSSSTSTRGRFLRMSATRGLARSCARSTLSATTAPPGICQ